MKYIFKLIVPMVFVIAGFVAPTNFVYAQGADRIDFDGADGADITASKAADERSIFLLKDELAGYVTNDYGWWGATGNELLNSLTFGFLGDTARAKTNTVALNLADARAMVETQRNAGKISDYDLGVYNKYRTRAKQSAQNMYKIANEIKRAAKAYNAKYFAGNESDSPFSADKLNAMLTGLGYVQSDSKLTLGYDKEGYILLGFDTAGWTEFGPRHGKIIDIDEPAGKKGKKASSGKWYDDEDADDDDDSGDDKKDCVDGSCNESKSSSGVHSFTRNLLPILGMLGTGFAAHSNYKLKKDMLRSSNRLISEARSNGQNPYMYMGLLRGAMNYDPFRFLGDSITPIMMSISEGYGGNGKSSFRDYYDSKTRAQIIQGAIARSKGNTQVSSNSTQNIQITRAIEGLKNFQNIFPTQDKLVDLMEKRLGAIYEDMSGGMSTRQRQDLINVVSNLSSGLQSQELFNKNMKLIFDQMRMLTAQARGTAQNQDAVINGNGGLTTTFTRTQSDNSSSNFTRQAVGNPGSGSMLGPQIIGGGGQPQFQVPQGGSGLTLSAGGNGQGAGASFSFRN